MTGGPILVTGTHRSGTTWVANVLALSPRTTLVGREPFNTGPRQWAVGGHAAVDYAYVGDLDEATARYAYGRVLNGRVPQLVGRRGRRQLRWLLPWAHPRVIIKDPLSAMSAAWLADTFDLDVVVVLRHPAAFAASLDRIGWKFDWHALQSQKTLLAGPLAGLAASIRRPSDDPHEQAGLLWRCVYTVLLDSLAGRPSWRLLRHEDAAMEPVTSFGSLYEALGLAWTSGVTDGLAAMTGAHNAAIPRGRTVHQLHRDSAAVVGSWQQRLSAAEQRRVRRGAAPLGDELYEWPTHL